MRLANAALTLILMACPCLAQVDAAQCRLIADRATAVTDSIETLQENIGGLTLAPLMKDAGPAVAASASEVDRERDNAVPAMKAYVAAMRALISQLDICGL